MVQYVPGLDFAVGAPYHDSGRVYVWMGGKDGVSAKPNQVRILKLNIRVDIKSWCISLMCIYYVHFYLEI